MNSMYREESEKDKNVCINLNLKRRGKSNKTALKKRKFNKIQI